MLGGDLVAEEPRRAGAGVGDQRLGLGQLELEILLQELSEATFDLLGLVLRSSEPEQDVICLCRVPSYAESMRALLYSARSWPGMLGIIRRLGRERDYSGARGFAIEWE